MCVHTLSQVTPPDIERMNERMDGLCDANNLQIIYSIAVDANSKDSASNIGIKRVAATIIGEFMKSLYVAEGSTDFQRKKYVDMVF